MITKTLDGIDRQTAPTNGAGYDDVVSRCQACRLAAKLSDWSAAGLFRFLLKARLHNATK